MAYLAPGRFEAPNWTRDGTAFLFNRDGHIERLAVGSEAPVKIDTGFATRCNNDHGISPDATQLAISDNSQERPRLARLHRADRWRHATAHHAEVSVVLAWLVAGWKDAGVCRPAQRRV